MLKMSRAMGVLAGVFVIGASTTASADYVIMKDTAYPSVLYIEFDDNTEASVISAPSDEAFGPPVVVGQPAVRTSTGSSAGVQTDPALPAVNDGHGGTISSTTDIDQRANQLSNMSAEQLEALAEQNAIDNELLSTTNLR